MTDEAPVTPDAGAPATPDTSPAAEPEVNLFEGLGTDFDDEIEVDLSSEAPAGGDEKPQTAKEPPKEPEPAQAAKPATPAAAPAQPPQTATPPATGQKEQPAPAAASPPSEPRPLVEQLGQHREAILSELASTRFAWDAGEQKQFEADLEADASKALVNWVPKLMSRMYYESALMALSHINNFVPRLIGNFHTQMRQHDEVEKQFFDQFKQLNKKDHWGDITQFANLFNQQNPRVSQADLLAMVGAAVMAKHKINPMAVQAGVGNGAAPTRKPAPPFVPAQAGGSAAKVTTEPESPYAGLGRDYDED